MATALLLVSPQPLAAFQGGEMPPIPTPFPEPDFHFSEPSRDAQYWRLAREDEQALATFRQSVDAARRALSPDPAHPSIPPRAGTTAWLAARAAIERAIHDRRTVRNAFAAMIAFMNRTGQEVPRREAEYSLDVRRMSEDMIRATSDTLVDFLAHLAGIPVHEWPA